MKLPVHVASLLVLVALTGLGAGQDDDPAEQLRRVRLAGEVRENVAPLAAADRLVSRQQHAQAIEEYQRLLLEGGDDLVPETTLPDRSRSTRRSVQLNRLCHVRIAAFPPAALKLYRARAEPLAERWLRQATVQHDGRLLRRIVDEAFCTHAAEKALDLLGDLAFEKGHFLEARHWWSLIAPPLSDSELSPNEPGRLVVPDPQLDPARVRAKQIVALIFEGDVPQAHAELRTFQARHGQAAGRLAGRTGNYAATLEGLLGQRQAGPLSPEEQDWPTFGGRPARHRLLTDALAERLWTDGPAWRVRLEAPEAEGEPAGAGRNEPRSLTARRLAFHPVIAGARVLVADARYVTAYHLHTGRRLFRYDLTPPCPSQVGGGKGGGEGLSLKLPAEPDVGYTLSVADGRVYARLGAPIIAPPIPGKPDSQGSQSYLVCLDLDSGRERWVVPAPRGKERERVVFEGAPLIHGGRAYLALSTLVTGWTRTEIVCHDALTGALRWRREVCEVPLGEGEPPRRRHHLLTLAGAAVVYCSHSGAVVAVDALTGKRLWGVRYPSQEALTAEGGSPRALAPCLAVDRRLFVAPLDSDRILCLDVDTGRTLWEREGTQVAHLLGVSQGRLIFTTARGVRALDVATGSDEGGWTQPVVGSLGSFGRGLLVGGRVLWPTQDVQLPLRLLSQEDGGQGRGAEAIDPTRLRRLRPGNMAFGGGCLVVADTEELVGYVPPRLRR
ncbi:MAG: PQQ-binding-like beta-propeller repeat protein [Gemmataceae bacterium]|nr:PQQ-binding-like beta-propeller repeat protein [Gemmataceae bacterium]